MVTFQLARKVVGIYLSVRENMRPLLARETSEMGDLVFENARNQRKCLKLPQSKVF